ncbi:DNA topoisomerase IB [Anaeromyxobacter diazotrophicus]|uniref:DNA topoisomerase n=1 Tax=Anaeromyxobacter diazotrophicus TaxID=2590199 RepID=A0A7I9VSH9_9BACT|nr:DNA topoisomerase IB [Anaeromyxobacter diazotrophicus]GEJ59080.1 DNA topoisomerase [Anaeromyxobacter diazotrophicus]
MTQLEHLQRHGIRRVGTPRSGFRFVAPGGKPVRNGARRRLHDLKLPPAWSDVYVSPHPGKKLQAVGRDRAGRWQYRYHASYRRRQESAKYRRLVRFAAALPALRAAVDRDLRRRGLPRERVLALAVHLLATAFMRAGSQQYARKNRSYGVATLRTRHVQVEGDTVRFDYPGKSGKRQVREVKDARVARLVRQLLAAPGRELLKFVADDGTVVDVRRRHINAYLREQMGGPFTAKDFRTWAGTLICACELARGAASVVPGRTDRKRMVVAAVKATAAKLGNTPAVCRSSYIYPAVLQGFSRGEVLADSFGSVEELAHQRGLHAAEKALLALLARGC